MLRRVRNQGEDVFSLSTTGPSDSDAASSSSSTYYSIMDRLKCPKHLELTGKQKILVNPPPVGKRMCRIKLVT